MGRLGSESSTTLRHYLTCLVNSSSNNKNYEPFKGSVKEPLKGTEKAAENVIHLQEEKQPIEIAYKKAQVLVTIKIYFLKVKGVKKGGQDMVIISH